MKTRRKINSIAFWDYTTCYCVCIHFSELARLREAVIDKKKLLEKTEKDMKTTADAESKLSVQLRGTRQQVEEAKSALQSHKSR